MTNYKKYLFSKILQTFLISISTYILFNCITGEEQYVEKANFILSYHWLIHFD